MQGRNSPAQKGVTTTSTPLHYLLPLSTIRQQITRDYIIKMTHGSYSIPWAIAFFTSSFYLRVAEAAG